MRIPLILTLLVCIATAASGQAINGSASPNPASDKSELPAGPLLRPAAEYSQWRVDYTYSDDQKSGNPGVPPRNPTATVDTRPRKIATTKTGRIIHEEITDVTDHQTSIWFNGGIQYTKEGNDPDWIVSERGIEGHTGFSTLPANGFRGLDWINASNYNGTVSYAGGMCLVFIPGGHQKTNAGEQGGKDKQLAASLMTAYIDAETRMPVALRTPTEVRMYHFGVAPTQSLELPADLADQIKKGNEARMRLSQPAPRPY